MATYSGQNFGKGDIPRIKKGVRAALLTSITYSILRADQVNGSLHNHCTGCGDGKLECHRNAHRELMAGICRMKLPVVFFRSTYPAWSDKYKKDRAQQKFPGRKRLHIRLPQRPFLKRMMRSRSRRTFNTAEKIRNISGVWLFPTARR